MVAPTGGLPRLDKTQAVEIHYPELLRLVERDTTASDLRADFTSAKALESAARHVSHHEQRHGARARRRQGHTVTAMTRRTFLARMGAAGALASGARWRLPIGYAQTSRGPAHAFLRRMPDRADFDRRVLGSFLEHLGRAIYTGVYEPGSRRASTCPQPSARK